MKQHAMTTDEFSVLHPDWEVTFSIWSTMQPISFGGLEGVEMIYVRAIAAKHVSGVVVVVSCEDPHEGWQQFVEQVESLERRIRK